MIIKLGCLNAVLSPLQNKCSFLIRNCIPFSQECLIPRFFDVCSGFRRWKVSNCNITPKVFTYTCNPLSKYTHRPRDR